MNKKLSLMGVVAMTFLGLLFVACDSDKDEKEVVTTTPSFTISQNAISASYEGGEYTFTYAVENPASDGKVSCAADVSWLNDFIISSDIVDFLVDENTGYESRTGNITATYTYSGGSLSQTVTVTQSSNVAPEFTVSPTSFEADGNGDELEFSYEITNPASDGVVTCDADVDWIGDYIITSSKVSFLVDANTTYSARDGKLTATYTYSGGVIEQEIAVAQAANEKPEITVEPTYIEAPLSGGTFNFSYSVTNPSADASVTCTADVTWISGFTYSDGEVGFTVAENADEAERDGVITVTYSYYGDAYSVTATVNVKQLHDMTLADLVGTYHCKSHVGDDESYEEVEWDLHIYYDPKTHYSDDGYECVRIDSPMPSYSCRYPSTEVYMILAYLDEDNTIVIPCIQLTEGDDPNCDYNLNKHGTYVYLAFGSTFEYIYDDGFDYDNNWSEDQPSSFIHSTYDASSKTWTFDHGMMMIDLVSYGNFDDNWYGWPEAMGETFTMTKTSDKIE